ncbi:MAG: hypothetical protein M1828_003439 [Chrysothrix sp. TS-e1954]|nr:MAG: hypothetical protein M1828_003439 [Chrysothrix sp. TS-e1954]
MTTFLYATPFAITGVVLAFFHYRQPSVIDQSTSDSEKSSEGPNLSKISTKNVAEKPETQSYKKLYHRVQNLEDFPDVLPIARQTLLSLLRQGVLVARLQGGQHNVLDITEYQPDQLASFMATKRQDTHDDWSSYLSRREAGGGPEMFADREAARQWIKQNAPLQLVDGAWVARVHNVTTPFALRGITKDAWQTYCEELGDGDLEKNHCFIYKELLHEVDFDMPDQNSSDFLDPRLGLYNDRIWRAGAGHLLISLFPNDFLPEILGFNLHYESLAPQTLKAAKELPEFGISGHYFAVHICIDNADSGHSAMAEATIRSYIDHVRRTDEKMVQQAWKRVQAGFLLSEYLDGDEDLSKYRETVAQMIHNKAGVAGQVHCSSRARIGGRKLTEWFSPNLLSSVNSHSWKNDFVAALARSKPWVYPGDSARGLLIRELSWKGRMFGAFTHSEVQNLRTWIDLLDNDGAADPEEGYSNLVGKQIDGNLEKMATVAQDCALTHPAFPPQREKTLASAGQAEFFPLPPIQSTQVKSETLLALWLVHPCILEQIVMSPHRTATSLGSRVLQLLRAESGYMAKSSGVAGMDEQRRPGYNPSLTTIGLQIARNTCLPEPTSLKDVLCSVEQTSPQATDFAYAVLSWAARPVSNEAFLLGLARAFLDLEVWVSCNEVLLGKEDRQALREIIERKQACFEEILSEIKVGVGRVESFTTGYGLGRTRLEKLLI